MEQGAAQQGNQERPRVLVVIGKESLANLVNMSLRYDGWEVETVPADEAFLGVVDRFAPAVIVLDTDQDTELHARLRSGGSLVPVLFLRDRDGAQQVNGLTAGGDDVLLKPFSIEEFAASLRALVRRARLLHGEEADPRIILGDLVLDEDSYEVTRGGEVIDLTTTEFELLRYFVRRPGRVLSKAQILDRVWRYDFDGKATVVELYLSYLRKKLDGGRAPMIHTVRGVGYTIKSAA